MKTDREISDETASLHQLSGKKVVTFGMDEYRSFCGAQKLHETKLEKIAAEIWKEHDLIMTWGRRIILVSDDSFTNRIKL